MPRFKYEFETELKGVLMSMGMRQAFGGGADFSAMVAANDLQISAVIHKAIIEGDEKGTKAAAATVVAMKKKTGKRKRKEPPTIRFDHPFTWYIVDQDKNVTLFSGRFDNK